MEEKQGLVGDSDDHNKDSGGGEEMHGRVYYSGNEDEKCGYE